MATDFTYQVAPKGTSTVTLGAITVVQSSFNGIRAMIL